MKENYTIFVTAKCQPRYRNSDLYEMKVQNVQQLYDVKEKRLEKFTISIPASKVTDETISNLSTLLDGNEGNTQLYIQLHTSENDFVTLRSKGKGINIDRKLLDYIAAEEEMDYFIN